jgi:hypothetical protein
LTEEFIAVSKKVFKVLFFRIFKCDTKEENLAQLTSRELTEILTAIQELPLDIGQIPSRYSGNGTNDDDFAVIFPNDNKKIPKLPGFWSGVFIRRRNSNYPFEEDGEGNLMELKLSDDSNEIAEMACFLIDVEKGILLWQSNRSVSGFNRFADYLTDTFRKAKDRAQAKVKSADKKDFYSPLIIGDKKAKIDFQYVINKEAISEFENDMEKIKSVSFKISGDMQELESLVSEKKSVRDDLLNLIKTANQSGAASLEYSIKAVKSTELKKSFISGIFQLLKDKLPSAGRHFQITGQIDDESRTLDLINDKLYYQTEIEISGRYLPAKKIFAKLEDAYKKYTEKLEA